MPAVFSFGLDPQDGSGPGRGQGSMAIPQRENDNKTTMAAGSNRAILPLFCLFLALSPLDVGLCDMWKEAGFDPVFWPWVCFLTDWVLRQTHISYYEHTQERLK